MKEVFPQSKKIALLESIPVLAVESLSQQQSRNQTILPCICFWYPLCQHHASVGHSNVING